MKLLDVLKDVDYELIQGDDHIFVNDIKYDSRKVTAGDMFVAMVGFMVDGHEYINKAIEQGASVIVCEKDIEVDSRITVVKVKNCRLTLATISRTFFGYPDKEMTTIGITGTKGKTTTSWTISKILDYVGKDCGVIGTMGVFFKDKYYHTVNTSPEAYEVYKYMREMLDNGVCYLVMEVSSQSLKLDRFKDMVFDYAVFTNLSIDHIGKDEHSSYEEYAYCKSKLFRQCKCGIFNIDDKEYPKMIDGVNIDIYTFGKDNSANLRLVRCENVREAGFIGIDVVVEGMVNDEFRVSIPGYFNSYNMLCAICVAHLLGVDNESIKEVLKNISVKGRLEPVCVSDKFSVLIDYAYQGIAMENVLKTIKDTNPKRIVTVFGCGGNRSRQRRFDCGEISGKYADLSIITADNPRYEDNDDIIKDILVGMAKTNGKYVIIGDRREAIKYSIVNAKEGDVILILGKGHEDYQEIKGVRYPFDERMVIKEILDSLSDEERSNL